MRLWKTLEPLTQNHVVLFIKSLCTKTEGIGRKKNGCCGGILLNRRCTAKGQQHRCLSMLMLRGIRHCQGPTT